jgi:hypothetical protein
LHEQTASADRTPLMKPLADEVAFIVQLFAVLVAISPRFG